MRRRYLSELLERGTDDPRDLPLATLHAQTLAREALFAAGLPGDDAPALELFRRAVDEGDQRAWGIIVELYRGFLIGQAGRLAIRGLVAEDDAFCVDRAFQRFWSATRSSSMSQFSDL